MREGRFGDLSRRVSNISGPFADRRPETMDREVAEVHPAHELRHRHVGERPTGLGARKDQVALLRDGRQNGDRLRRKRHPVLLASLHTMRGYRISHSARIPDAYRYGRRQIHEGYRRRARNQCENRRDLQIENLRQIESKDIGGDGKNILRKPRSGIGNAN